MDNKKNTTVKKNVEKTNKPIKEEKIKESKTETKRLAIIFGFIAIMVFIAILSVIMTNKKSANIVASVQEALAGSDPKAVYVMRTDCTYCTLNEPNMQSLKEEYNVDYLEINTSELNSDDLATILSMLGVETSEFGTPYLTVVQENEVKGSLTGVKSFNEMFDFLQDLKVIDNDAELYLNYIDHNSYMKTIKSKENEIIVLASSTCHYCLSERIILDEVAQEYDLKINWMNLDYAFSEENGEEEYEEFQSSLEWLEDNDDWGTPTTLIVNNGKVVSALSGYREKSEVVEFYKQNGFINE